MFNGKENSACTPTARAAAANAGQRCASSPAISTSAHPDNAISFTANRHSRVRASPAQSGQSVRLL